MAGRRGHTLQANAGDRDKTLSCSCLVSKRKNFVSRARDHSPALRGPSRLGGEKFLGLLRPPAPSPCPGGVQPRILGCATPRQPRCPPAHGNRTGGRTGNASNRSPETFSKNKNTGRVCGDPLPSLPLLLCAGFLPGPRTGTCTPPPQGKPTALVGSRG